MSCATEKDGGLRFQFVIVFAYYNLIIKKKRIILNPFLSSESYLGYPKAGQIFFNNTPRCP